MMSRQKHLSVFFLMKTAQKNRGFSSRSSQENLYFVHYHDEISRDWICAPTPRAIRAGSRERGRRFSDRFVRRRLAIKADNFVFRSHILNGFVYRQSQGTSV